jgi:DNA-binding transcriptional LysR family regulator
MYIRHISNWKLRLFCEAYICTSYTQAAENMHIAQTSVTKAIDDIEYVINKTLFVRTTDGMLPTRDADELFQKIKSSLDAIENALSSKVEDPFKTFAVAGNHSVCCTVFPVAIRKMKEDGYNVSHFAIYNTDPQNAISLLRRQVIQAAMFPQSAIPNDIRVHASDTADAVLLVHKDHHFLKKEKITIEDLKKENFMLIDEYKINDKYREFFKDFYANNTFHLHNADWEIIMHFVAQNLGVCPLLDI